MRLGLDYGGTKIEGIVLGPDGTERARARVPTPRFDYDGGVRAIRGLLEQLEGEAGGRIETRRHRRAGLGRPHDRRRHQGQLDLAARPRPARRPRGRAGAGRCKIANDANCFALSEAVDGAGAGAQVVFGVILGTGVGGGIVVDGQLVEGVNADRRRMGARAAADAARRRAARAALLVRRRRPRRGLAVGAELRRRLCPAQADAGRGRAAGAGGRRAGRGRRRRRRGDAARATRTGSGGRWR